MKQVLGNSGTNEHRDEGSLDQQKLASQEQFWALW